jgi:catechol 2,3-dioxygenase-like lactoylglutathione lyase family enzyme
MTAKPQAAEAAFVHAAPQLPTRDLAKTKEWYERHLGFKALEGWKEWDFLILERDGVRLHFFPHGDPKAAEAGSFYLRVSGDIDALAARMKAEGVDVHDGAEDRPYGMRDFTAHDADGRHVLIGKPIGGSR